MAYELSSDVLRAAQLARELQVSEAALRESDRRMTMAADAARLGMWIWDLGSREVWLSTKCREMFAFAPDEPVTYESFVTRLHPDDRGRIETELQRALEVQDAHRTDYRLVLPNRTMRWIAAQMRIDRDEQRAAIRMLGICIDVTEHRNAEIAARELSGRLISAQEDERRRIARDLHDDLSQRLSVLSVDLELFARTQTERRGVVQLASQVQELSSEVHKVAYQLHPAKLDQLGLEIAVRSWCRDVTQQSGVRVEFVAADVPRDVPADVALCLYRITQEALRNVVRHSQAGDARVELMSTGDELHLLVADFGRGFNVDAATKASGLGLVGMRERALILGGRLSVCSIVGEGTRVTVSIPLPPRGSVDPAVGSSGVRV
jgi:signal transduction histidine kinase